MSTHIDEAYMARALELALEAPLRTSPNPTVGCVVVAGGRIVGEGVTQPVGGPHAEVMALRAAGNSAQGGQLYVTLEPCAHHGRTPPCVDAIIEAGISEVFVGVRDVNPLVDGGGIKALVAAGVEVQHGVLEAQCARHHAPFFKFITHRRPWVILKGAMTLDGCIATEAGHSQWITGEDARTDVHQLRARCDAILVGARTAHLDNPSLTVRHVEGEDPLRVILDSTASIRPDAAALGPNALLVHGSDAPSDRVSAIANTGSETLPCPRDERGLNLEFLLDRLAAMGIVTLLVEGGGRIHGSFLAGRLADSACFYLAPKLIGRGRPIVDLPSPLEIGDGWHLEDIEYTQVGSDLRIRGKIGYPAREGET